MNRWFRLISAVVAMIMIANLQYAWTLFVKPLLAEHNQLGANHWKLSDVQWAFTFFIACQTWFMPVAGWLIDKVGPRKFVTMAGILCGAGWAALSTVNSLPALYTFYSAAGIGAALVYCGSMGVALKWFPDKRGLAAGITAAGYGSGTALFIPIITHILHGAGYKTAFLYTGVAQGLLIVCAAQFLRNPSPGEVTAVAGAVKKNIRNHNQDFTSAEMLRTPTFYILYLMMLLMGVGGLMVTAQLGPLADNFKVSAAILTVAATMNPIANGSSRLFWGWASDHMGRERAMIVAFLLQSLALVSVPLFGRGSDSGFIICLMLVYFTWGEVYSLFPSLTADIFGMRNASANYGFLYSTKGVASIIGGGLAAILFEKFGDWNMVFYGAAVLALCSALMAMGLVKMPLPRKKQTDVFEGSSPAAIPAEGVGR